MAAGLSVSDVVNVTTSISPVAAPTRNFGAALHVGVSDVINVSERIRSYSDMTDVSGDFGTGQPEYIAATRHFGQSPTPSVLYIGRWAQTATAGVLFGGVLSASQQLLANFTVITSGSMVISIDGSVRTVTGLNFSGALNLPGVAAVLQTALTAYATVIWDANNDRFVVESKTTGTSSSVSYASTAGSGTDVSGLLLLTSATASAPVVGIAAETLAAGIQALINANSDWYSASILPSVSNSVALAASAVIEAAQPTRIIGYTIQSSTVLDPTNSSDLASALMQSTYTRSYCQYSSSDPYAICSFFGRAATIDFTGSNTTLTMKFKIEPGVAPETITENQAAALKAKRCNVFVTYQNSTAIIQEGVMSSGLYFDERQGIDWLQNDVQTAIYNLLYTTNKVPQTDPGMNQIQTVIEGRLGQAVRNGLAAPGIWNAAGFGTLKMGDTLPKGFYVYMSPVATQSQADREARKSTLAQCAIKFAGAVHSVNCILNFNR